MLMNNSALLSPKGTDLTQPQVAGNTNAYSISNPLKVRHYFEAGTLCWQTNRNPPMANPVLFEMC